MLILLSPVVIPCLGSPTNAVVPTEILGIQCFSEWCVCQLRRMEKWMMQVLWSQNGMLQLGSVSATGSTATALTLSVSLDVLNFVFFQPFFCSVHLHPFHFPPAYIPLPLPSCTQAQSKCRSTRGSSCWLPNPSGSLEFICLEIKLIRFFTANLLRLSGAVWERSRAVVQLTTRHKFCSEWKCDPGWGQRQLLEMELAGVGSRCSWCEAYLSVLQALPSVCLLFQALSLTQQDRHLNPFKTLLRRS